VAMRFFLMQMSMPEIYLEWKGQTRKS